VNRLTYAIVGGGVAAATAADAIRRRDSRSAAAVFTREWAPPYQRPPLSKEYLQGKAGIDTILMKPATWYVEREVLLYPGVAIEHIDPAAHTLAFAGRTVEYERLLLATGAVPRHLSIPGAGLEGVFTLRTYGDAEQLRAVRAAAQRVVVVGSGFIGMEVAASLRSGGCEITVVTIDAALYERFGADVSAFAAGLFDRHGIQTVFHSGITSIDGETRVTGVTLKSGERIACQAVIIGIGVDPDAELARQGRLRTDDGILVDDRLRASKADVFAAGDVARFPGLDGTPIRVEHFDHAYASGACAGANMAGDDTPYRYVPYFWSDVFELSFEFVGDPTGEARVVEGSPASGSFVVEYEQSGVLRGALLASRTPEERDTYRARLMAAHVEHR
jgi:3-phenylpropionate/trans-cinnamate dioxygenase ferredoxin reductase component